jgi:GNAT superfamily N-acetyltransferase
VKVELLLPQAPEWQSVLSSSGHDFYHLPGYAALCAKTDTGEALAAIAEDSGRRLLLPLIVRPVPGAVNGLRDGTSPYGYPGPIWSSGAELEFVGAALHSVFECLRGEGLTSLFVRLHPLLNAELSVPCGTTVSHGSTVFVDLLRSDEELWSETMSGHRNEINRALKLGHRAYFDETWENLDRFCEMYAATMERVGAGAYYFFDRQYFHDLRSALGERLHLGLVEVEGTIAAGALFVETSGIVQYHLAGSDPAYVRHRPGKLLIHHARSWAKARGARYLHLGGGVGAAEDSLLKFKAGFSKQRSLFRTVRVVLRSDEYASLVHEKHPDADVEDLSGFFPLYRKA